MTIIRIKRSAWVSVEGGSTVFLRPGTYDSDAAELQNISAEVLAEFSEPFAPDFGAAPKAPPIVEAASASPDETRTTPPKPPTTHRTKKAS